MNILFIAAFFLFGLVFGSFLNVCIYRMPRQLSVVRPRSACPSCETPIAAYDNIPVLSWLLLGGKCRHCKAAISPRYAAVELATAIIFLLAYVVPQTAFFIKSYEDSLRNSFSIPPAANLLGISLKLCVLSFLLIGLIFTDAETKLLPDLLTKPGMALGLLFSLLVPLEGPAQFLLRRVDNWRILSLVNSLAGMLLGSAFILGVALVYEALRGVEGMGRGDVKLMGLIGAFLGIKLTLLVLVLGSLIGSIFGVILILIVWRKRLARRKVNHPREPASQSRKRAWQSAILIYRNFEIPFGVFLGTAALLAAFDGDPIVRSYLQLYR
jgi:leader peptidase (prepilin peptidase) / N-methyltransferase